MKKEPLHLPRPAAVRNEPRIVPLPPIRHAALQAKVLPLPAVHRAPGRAGILQGFFPGGPLHLAGAGVLQPREAGASAVALPPTFSLPSGGGQPMPEGVRRDMESHFKTDFSAVRVHVGAHVPVIGALAFTIGNSIHFAPGHYQPDAPRGRQLLAHELTHVVQQRSGRVRNPFGSSLAIVQDAALEAEAERMALRLAASRPTATLPAHRIQARLAAPVLPSRSVQRMSRKERKAHATFLNTTATTLFNSTADSKLMEVQSAIFDGKMFIASNYSKGNNDSALAGTMAASYTHGGVTYQNGTLVRLAAASGLHAEQQILEKLAAALANPNKTPPSHVTVIGSKRPCSVCRRVLLAFRKGLVTHYPEVSLHFVNQTGKDTAVASLDLDAMAATADQKFKDFVTTYNAELARLAGQALSGEDVSNATRTNAAPDVDEML